MDFLTENYPSLCDAIKEHIHTAPDPRPASALSHFNDGPWTEQLAWSRLSYELECMASVEKHINFFASIQEGTAWKDYRGNILTQIATEWLAEYPLIAWSLKHTSSESYACFMFAAGVYEQVHGDSDFLGNEVMRYVRHSVAGKALRDIKSDDGLIMWSEFTMDDLADAVTMGVEGVVWYIVACMDSQHFGTVEQLLLYRSAEAALTSHEDDRALIPIMPLLSPDLIAPREYRTSPLLRPANEHRQDKCLAFREFLCGIVRRHHNVGTTPVGEFSYMLLLFLRQAPHPELLAALVDINPALGYAERVFAEGESTIGYSKASFVNMAMWTTKPPHRPTRSTLLKALVESRVRVEDLVNVAILAINDNEEEWLTQYIPLFSAQVSVMTKDEIKSINHNLLGWNTTDHTGVYKLWSLLPEEYRQYYEKAMHFTPEELRDAIAHITVNTSLKKKLQDALM